MGPDCLRKQKALRCVSSAAVGSPAESPSFRAGRMSTQAEFALRLGLDEQTIVNWEFGCAVPMGPAEVLVRVLEREPEAFARAVA